MMKYFSLTLLGLIGLVSNVHAQEPWSLKQCIDQALASNIQVQQAELSVSSAEANYQQTKAGALPTVNAFASHGYNWGQTIDPFTNQFATNRVRSNSFSISSNMVVFSGLSTWNSIQMARVNNEAARFDIESMKNDIAMTVTTTYLSVLFNMELVENARNQLDISRQQVERIRVLVAAGQLAKGDMLDMEAQMANDELNLVNQENALQISYLNLAQLLMLNPDQASTFAIQRPSLDMAENANAPVDAKEVFNTAVQNMPEIKSGEMRVMSSDYSVNSAKGGRYPRLSASLSYGTGYSGAAQNLIGLNPTGNDTVGFTSIGFEPVVSPTFTPIYEDKPFGEQFTDNVNTSLNFSLTIPIFNGYQTKNSVQQARINRENAVLDLEARKNQLRVTIEQSYVDALAALKRFRAAEKSVAALEESFKYSRVRYEEKMINTVDFNDAKNKLAQAQSDLVQAKYDYIFKTKILDFYQGKPLTL